MWTSIVPLGIIAWMTLRKRVIEMKGDGNCLFRALVYRRRETHEEMRESLVSHIRKNWDNYAPFLTEEDRHTYVATMQKNGEWGDELILNSFCDKYKCTVRVLDEDDHHLISVYGTEGEAKAITYDGVHYNVIARWAPLTTIF